MSEFKCLGCVLDDSGIDCAGCCRKVASGREVAVPIRSLVIAKGLLLECARVLHETLLVTVLWYGVEGVV